MFDLGDPVPLSVEILDANGNLANAGAVTLTVTLPDGSTSSPSVTNGGTGVYTATFVTTQEGRHTVRWVATGANASAFTDAFDVAGAASQAIVSLDDVKAHLNITSTTNDEELRFAILAASDWVESKIGPVAKRIYTQTVRCGGSPIALDHAPVISVTSVTPAGGVALSALSLDADLDAGLIYPAFGYSWPTWTYGTVTVVYVAGRTVVPAAVQWATKEYVAWLWDTQRGAAQASPAQADLDQFGTGTFATVPRRIEQALEPYLLAPAVA